MEDYQGYKTFEFELKWDLKRSIDTGHFLPVWSYGRMIFKDGYVIFMIGDTKDNISELKAIFETLEINF